MATSNGRITLALLGQKVDILTTAIEGLRGDLKALAERHASANTVAAVLDNRVDDLEHRVNGWNLLNSLGVIIAAILAALGLSQR